MILKDIIITPEFSMEDFSLFQIQSFVREAIEKYLNGLNIIHSLRDNERENHIVNCEITLRNSLNEQNEIYKQNYLHVDRKYKKAGMTVWSYNGVELTELLEEQFDFKFNRKFYNKRTRVKYDETKLMNAMICALALLFAKYETVYTFQVQATFVKLICDYFIPETIECRKVYDVLIKLMMMDYSVITKKINQLNMTPAKKIKKETKKTPKLQWPTKENFEEWLKHYSVTEIKKEIARQFNCSEKTVQRKLAEYGLTRKYTRIENH